MTKHCQHCKAELFRIRYKSKNGNLGALEKIYNFRARDFCIDKPACREAAYKRGGAGVRGYPPRMPEPQDKFLDAFNFKLLVPLQRMI